MTILYLLPTPIAEGEALNHLPPANLPLILECKCFVVEELRTARRFLKAIDKKINIDELTFFELNEHTETREVESILSEIAKQNKVILMSEAGCPGVADPGAQLVKLAHKKGIKVVPLIGPSSIIMAVMASGLNGQQFAFNGYLPKDKAALVTKIRSLEKLSAVQSQWFIETPYRNNALLDELLGTLNGNTLLCIAANLSASDEFIKTRSVNEWKKEKPDLNKIPSVFGIGQ